MPENQNQKGTRHVSDTSLLYNSGITKTYLAFIKKTYPDLDIDSIINYAGMTKYEVEDPAHWFNQDQTDRFQEILTKKTGNPNIAREAGQYVMSYEGLGPGKKYALGLMN